MRVGERLRLGAARRLVSGGRGTVDEGRRFLDAAEQHRIDLTHLWASLGPDGLTPRQVALGVIGPGRSAMLFCSAPMRREEEPELAAVIDRLCRELTGARLAQALLEPEEHGARSALRTAGFIGVGRLAYMRCPLAEGASASRVASPDWPAGIGVRGFRPGEEAVLATALDRTYIDTLDCPELCGLRETRDVLESHRATGEFDPALWWLVEAGGGIEGAMLFNRCPEQGTVELVYLGLSPAIRGRGLGRRLLDMGLSVLQRRGERLVTCAVDERNVPARNLYGRLGFTDIASRMALVKPIGGSAVENARGPA